MLRSPRYRVGHRGERAFNRAAVVRPVEPNGVPVATDDHPLRGPLGVEPVGKSAREGDELCMVGARE